MEIKKNPLWHQVTMLAILPVIIFLWIVGWALICLGAQRDSPEINQKAKILETNSTKEKSKTHNENRYV